MVKAKGTCGKDSLSGANSWMDSFSSSVQWPVTYFFGKRYFDEDGDHKLNHHKEEGIQRKQLDLFLRERVFPTNPLWLFHFICRFVLRIGIEKVNSILRFDVDKHVLLSGKQCILHQSMKIPCQERVIDCINEALYRIPGQKMGTEVHLE